MSVDLDVEAARLKKVMDNFGNVNIFISEVRSLNTPSLHIG
jgi:hypothetical protein